MEKGLQKFPLLESPTDSDDANYVSGLSTILVATIQDAKDRISQIEYIFCSQLFPSFQSKSKSVQKIYFEAKKAAEDEWKEKEKDMLLQIEKLQSDKQQAFEENHCLKLEKKELRLELMKKSKEVDGGMELQNKLLQLIHSKASLFVHKGKQLKEHGEKKNNLLSTLKNLEEKVAKLQVELIGKHEEVVKGKVLQENLFKRIESQDSKIANNEELLNSYEKEKKLLIAKLENLENNVDGLRVELGKKIEEAEEGRQLQEQLYQKIELTNSVILKTERELEELKKEKQLHLAKLKHFDEKLDKLQGDLRERSNESVEGMELHGKLLLQIEVKDSELLSEKKKKGDVIVAYKKLKSQYNFLRTKFGLTTKNMLPQVRKEDEHDSLRCDHMSPDIENIVPNAFSVGCEMTKQKDDHPKFEDPEGVRLIQISTSDSPSSFCSPIPIHSTNANSGTPVGSKRPVSYWKDTRSHQNRGGPDPHDDFLDTPLENIRGNLKKFMSPDPVPKDVNFDSLNNETQEMNVDLGSMKQQMQPPMPGTGGYKYVEPVRKKVEREKLKGIECKQCKKFYDAVLPDDGGKDTESNKQNLRCERHDGVSRHRYRYAPPLTPEGFWNIGFESEM